ncbi:MAG: hypothetical protein H7A06_10825 [Pseudomonadales bacterium]|nr:hypothetical protein [Pseudomonadales bacterium]
MMRTMSLLVLLLALLGSSTLWAQSPGDLRQRLSGLGLDGSSNAALFATGLTRDQGISYRDQARATDEIRIAIQLTPDPANRNHPGDIFVVVFVGDTPHMVTPQGLQPWAGSIDTLQPLQSNVMLTETMNLDVFSGTVGSAGTFPFYVAYRDRTTGDFSYSATATRLQLTTEKAPTESFACNSYGNQTVNIGYRNATGVFTHAPFNASDFSLLTNGEETNDARFAYNWIRKPGEKVNIFAPADGVLIRLRHKAENLPDFPSDDFDLIFLVACDPDAPQKQTMFRFNHITDPRPDIKAAYAFGALGAPEFNPFNEHEERQLPTQNIRVKAGDYLGSTSGTPTAHNFDFQISIDDATVCPFSVLEEPHRSTLLALMGPQGNSPSGPPVAGYPCQGYGARP